MAHRTRRASALTLIRLTVAPKAENLSMWAWTTPQPASRPPSPAIKRTTDVIQREVTGGKKNLGVFYGAAHFPDLEKRLLDAGYKRIQQDWLTASDISKQEAKPAAAMDRQDSA